MIEKEHIILHLINLQGSGQKLVYTIKRKTLRSINNNLRGCIADLILIDGLDAEHFIGEDLTDVEKEFITSLELITTPKNGIAIFVKAPLRKLARF